MKKNLLIAAMVLPLLSVSAQWTQTGGTVSVKPNTLHYMSGSYEVKNGGKAINEGNVNVRGSFTIDNITEPTTEFRNKYNGGTQYGQLIINESSTATGKIVGEFLNTAHTQFFNQPLAIPYTDMTAQEIAEQSNIQNPIEANHPRNGIFDPNRWKNSVYTWLNEDYALADMSLADKIEPNSIDKYFPTNYYSINLGFEELTSQLAEYKGTPANMVHDTWLDPVNINPGSEAQVNNYSKNMFGEMLGTYLKDAFTAMPDHSAWSTPGRYNSPDGYGDNVYYFGNPYTSNIRLDSLLGHTGMIGVTQFQQNNFDPNVDQGNSNIGPLILPLIATYNGGEWQGDLEALEVRPYHTFAFKQDPHMQIINFGDREKTFGVDVDAPHYNTARNQSSTSYQVKLELLKNDNTVGRTYVVASSNYEAAAQAGNEAYLEIHNSDFDQIYTLQENADGTVNQELMNSKVYINGINAETYTAKPVMLANQVANPGQFTIKANLSNNVLNSGNEFYFEDAQEGFIQNITEDFEYTFTANETTTDRFRIYWNGTPEVLNVSEVESVAKTLVYKNVDDTFKVRFAENWNKADIFVYNVMGQLVHSAKSVDASIDYTLPLKGHTSAYIVKAVSDKGEVATQKIIKK
ncbi:T9SS type A sorting domain-containing protein [Weeksellaceae bacterium KMM 9724]|uniref:T9SS type A sorting domain-containing protein n=1 Tax=Profundicola chukchiensis TaxID=2961959 RepID=UPI002437B5BB|nr:T9SS type A sorting domain-containing protein [Profundicola chukchiensis]MDG4949954.1 T9SS type A sorting domain-containing protein [Profundicola chukchiensis]